MRKEFVSVYFSNCNNDPALSWVSEREWSLNLYFNFFSAFLCVLCVFAVNSFSRRLCGEFFFSASLR